MRTDEPLLLQYIRSSRSGGHFYTFSQVYLVIFSLDVPPLGAVFFCSFDFLLPFSYFCCLTFSSIWFIRSVHGLSTHRGLSNSPNPACLFSKVYKKGCMCVYKGGIILQEYQADLVEPANYVAFQTWLWKCQQRTKLWLYTTQQICKGKYHLNWSFLHSSRGLKRMGVVVRDPQWAVGLD